MIKITVMKMVDYDVTGENHVSISGGRATHSFNVIDTKKVNTIAGAVKWINETYGKPFIFEDRLELQLNESETLSFYLDEIIENHINMGDLTKEFPELEVY